MESDWYQGKTEIASFEPEEIFGTKPAHWLQRRKSRDLFDLHHGLDQLAMDPDQLIACFDHCLALEGNPITRAVAEQSMLEKPLEGIDRPHQGRHVEADRQSARKTAPKEVFRPAESVRETPCIWAV